ncbi:MAG: alpha/beta hydrolase [Deltaproteobacteria bacterium]
MGQPQIIVLPGLDGDVDLRAPLQAALSKIAPCQVIGYPRDIADYGDMQSHVAPLLPAGDFILIAESYGGPLAVMLAARGLPGLKGIVFVVTFAHQPRYAPQAIVPALGWLPKPGRLAMRAILWLGGGWRAKSSAIAAMTEVGLRLPGETTSGRLKAVMSVDVRRELAALNVPMVYLQAASDQSVPRRAADDFVAAGAELIRLPGTHYLLEETPDRAAAVLHDPIQRMLATL